MNTFESKHEHPGTSVFDVESLQNNPFILLPDHGYTLPYSPEQVKAVEITAKIFQDRYAKNPEFPNARFMINFMPALQPVHSIDFMFAWGKATEFPNPRIWKLPHYFSAPTRFMSRVLKTPLEKTTLDAYGYVGHISASMRTAPKVIALGRSAEINPVIVKSEEQLDEAFFQKLESTRPLRFHAGLRYHPRNGHVTNYFAGDNQSSLLRHPLLDSADAANW